MSDESRHIVWFSCGCASAVAGSLVIKDQPKARFIYIHIESEHEDNFRFIKDFEQWLNVKVEVLSSEKYKDQFDVIKRTRYVNGVAGARCTAELKKKVRFDFQEPDDIQYFGFSVEEKKRALRFSHNFPEANSKYPLIRSGLTKIDCAEILLNAGIRLPRMYELGYNNNNCIGCVKGGMGYWNKIRIDFPSQYEKMKKLEREVGHSCIKGKFLDELNPNEGRHVDFKMSCGFDCENGENI